MVIESSERQKIIRKWKKNINMWQKRKFVLNRVSQEENIDNSAIENSNGPELWK